MKSFEDKLREEREKRKRILEADYKKLGTYQAVGDKHGISRQRVFQLIGKVEK